MSEECFRALQLAGYIETRGKNQEGFPAPEGRAVADYRDFVHTGPNTLAGRYMRKFWQPVYVATDLKPGRAVPLRIMSEDFTLYRGEAGAAHITGFRCAHRGTQLSVGWIEGDSIRCFYHGWKFDGSGQCVEQPAESQSFAAKVRIPSYPTQEYLGLIFVYLGEGESPPLPRYPEFESPDCVLLPSEHTYLRRCNFFSDLENALDPVHAGFVHMGRKTAFDGRYDPPLVMAEETAWGICMVSKRPSGMTRVQQSGMPNILHLYAQSALNERTEDLLWFVPVDDEAHIEFGVTRIPLTGEAARQYCERRAAMLAKLDQRPVELAEEILAGRLRLDDTDPERVHMVTLEDHVAQAGQGRIADRTAERLGRSDIAIILLRKIWARELRALADGRPLKHWSRSMEATPTTWQMAP